MNFEFESAFREMEKTGDNRVIPEKWACSRCLPGSISREEQGSLSHSSWVSGGFRAAGECGGCARTAGTGVGVRAVGRVEALPDVFCRSFQKCSIHSYKNCAGLRCLKLLGKPIRFSCFSVSMPSVHVCFVDWDFKVRS